MKKDRITLGKRSVDIYVSPITEQDIESVLNYCNDEYYTCIETGLVKSHVHREIVNTPIKLENKPTLFSSDIDFTPLKEILELIEIIVERNGGIPKRFESKVLEDQCNSLINTEWALL